MTLVAGNIVNLAYLRFAELRADTFAIQECSKEELEGGKRIFQELLKEESSKSNLSIFEKVKQNPLSLLDWSGLFNCHPSAQQRIAKIDKVLKKYNHVS